MKVNLRDVAGFTVNNKKISLYRSVLLASMLVIAGCASAAGKSSAPGSELSEGIAQNNKLVLDIIFSECLPYIKDGVEPFSSFPILPPTEEAVNRFDDLSKDEALMHLFSTRYSVILGASSCGLVTMEESPEAEFLGVDRSEFLEAVEAQAVESGLTDGGLSDFEYDRDFSPLKTIAWYEPEVSGEKNISLLLMVAPGTPVEPQGGLVEIGIIHLIERTLP